MHAATSKVENSAQGLSCKLKFVHGLGEAILSVWLTKQPFDQMTRHRFPTERNKLKNGSLKFSSAGPGINSVKDFDLVNYRPTK
jgi:hypothetical protein